MADQLELTWEPNPSTAPLLRLKGRLDVLGTERLRDEARRSLQVDGRVNLVVDLAGLEFVASTGLATFLLLTEEFTEVQGTIIFANATPAVKQVISLLNIDQFLNLAASEETAMEMIGA